MKMEEKQVGSRMDNVDDVPDEKHTDHTMQQ